MSFWNREFSSRNESSPEETSKNSAQIEQADIRDTGWHMLWKFGHESCEVLGQFSLAGYTLGLSNDENRLAAAGQNGRIVSFDLASGKPLVISDAAQGEINCLSFSPNDRYLASVGDDGSCCIWDAENLQLLKRWPAQASGVCFQVRFLDNDTLVTTGKF